MKTKILNVDSSWVRVKNACRVTVNKKHTDNEPNGIFKMKILLSEHSPIRLIRINWMWEKIKSWIATHYVRHHEGIEKWVSTQRSDRINKNRDDMPQGAPVTFEAEANAQSLINMGRVRLCNMAHVETRKYYEDLKLTIHEIEPELSEVLVPNCIYRCGCPEFEACGFWKAFVDKHKDKDLLNIQTRYELYNEEFYKKKG
jgi:hypothetical protein